MNRTDNGGFSLLINTLNNESSTTENLNISTESLEPELSKANLRLAFDVIIISCMLAIMFAMGCEVSFKQLTCHLKKPVGILIGMVSQFALLPFLGFSAIKILKIEGVHATSILILSCSPGGGYSNLITYLLKGDVSLSVAMTTVSNILALGATPFNVWIYSQAVETGEIKIPFKEMAISMVGLTAILSFGVLLRWKFPNVATIVTKVGVIGSGVMAIACGALALVLYPKFFQNIPWFLYCAVAFVGPLGLIIAYCMAWLFKQTESVRRTIAVESAVQNIGTAITIVIISFTKSALKEMSVYIILYAGITTCGLLMAASTLAVVDYVSGAKVTESVGQEMELKADQNNSSLEGQDTLKLVNEDLQSLSEKKRQYGHFNWSKQEVHQLIP